MSLCIPAPPGIVRVDPIPTEVIALIEQAKGNTESDFHINAPQYPFTALLNENGMPLFLGASTVGFALKLTTTVEALINDCIRGELGADARKFHIVVATKVADFLEWPGHCGVAWVIVLV